MSLYKHLLIIKEMCNNLEYLMLVYMSCINFTFGPLFILNLMSQLNEVDTGLDPISNYLFHGLGIYHGYLSSIYFILSDSTKNEVCIILICNVLFRRGALSFTFYSNLMNTIHKIQNVLYKSPSNIYSIR